MSEISYGYGHIRVGDGEELVAPNYPTSPVTLEAIFNNAVGSGFGGEWYQCVAACPFFNRYSALRYRRDADVVVIGRPTPIKNYDTAYAVWMDDTHAAAIDRVVGVKVFNRTQIPTTGPTMAVGSVSMVWYNTRYLTGNGFLPNGHHTAVAITAIDIPGTQIGQVFKHPIDRSAFFNEVSIIALSQGAVNIEGVYAPEENKAYTMAYRVYFAKSGGTGIIVGAVKANGETFPATTNNYTFKDATFAGFAPGDADGNHYIAIRSGTYIGTYKITAYIDASTVETDAATINEAFGNETGLTWTMRTGPIGEYFFQRRMWTKTLYWYAGYMSYAYHTQQLTHMHQEIPVAHRAVDFAVYPAQNRSIHDRGACWWWVQPHLPQAQAVDMGLARWKAACLEGYDYPVAYNSFSGLAMPTGAYGYRDIAIDLSNKLWICWSSGTDNYRLMKVDPYPLVAGVPNSKNPEILGRYLAQTSFADATGLCNNNPRGIVCDDGGMVWVLHGGDGGGLANGGISYTPDGGTTWKRLHILSANLSGTATVVNGTSGVTGAGTAFDTELAAGDWVRFGSDTRSYEIASIAGPTTMTLAINYQGTGGAYSFKRGALSDTQARLYFGDNYSNWNTADHPHRPPCDFDSDGNLYWISDAQTGVLRWKPADGKVTEITNSQLSKAYTFSLPKTLCVTRFTNVAGSGLPVFQNNVWVGSFNTDMARIYDWDNFLTGADGVTNGTTTFTSASAPFSANDVGKWLVVTTKGTYYIRAYISPTQVTLNTTVSAGSSLAWSRENITRYNWQYPTGADGVTNGTATFVAASGTFTAADVGKMVSIPAKGFYTIIGYVSASTVTLNTTVSAGTALSWSLDNFPAACDFPDYAGAHYGVQVVQDRVSGTIAVLSLAGSPTTYVCYVRQVSQGIGTLWNYGGVSTPYVGHVNQNMASSRNLMFDDVGLGSTLALGHPYLNATDNEGYFHGMLHYSLSMSFRWNGSAWAPGRVNPFHNNISFASTPALEAPTVLGAGLKRVHEYTEPLDAGLYIKFTQAGGATLQTNEYIVDENATFLGVIGSAKDNTQTADIGCSSYCWPSVYRVDEPVRNATAPWTANDGGVDGGYVNNATQSTMPVFMRGPAEGTYFDMGAGTGAVTYPLTTAFSISDPANPQYMACLRIKDEYAPDTTDGTIPGVGDTFTKGAGLGRDWDSGDLYKTIYVEGSSSGNNGRYVITEILTASNVRVHRSFAAAESVRWKLRDVPAVGYVAMQFYYARVDGQVHYTKSRLYASVDYGQTWDLTKKFDTFAGCSPNDPITTYKDAGIRFDSGSQGSYYATTMDSTSSCSIIFDLRGLSQVERRKQYWKVTKQYVSSSMGARPASILLLDENFKRLGIPEDCQVTDFHEPLLVGATPRALYLVPYDGTGNAVGVDMGYGYAFTDIVSAPSDTFYEDSGADGVTSGSNFSSASAAFTINDLGKHLRIPAEGGFCTITALVSATSVTTDKVFTGGSSLAWALTRFAKDDYLVLKEYTTSFKHLNRGLVEFPFKILDIPSATTIQLTTKTVPVSANFPFCVCRTAASTSPNWTSDTWAAAASGIGYNYKVGQYHVNENAEFITIHSGSSATPKADTDGDGRTDEVVLTVDLDTAAVAGDVILLYKDGASLFSRFFEIRSINRLGGGVTDVRTWFDEIQPGTGPYKWKVLRRRGMKILANRVEVATTEALP